MSRHAKTCQTGCSVSLALLCGHPMCSLRLCGGAKVIKKTITREMQRTPKVAKSGRIQVEFHFFTLRFPALVVLCRSSSVVG